MVKKKINRNLNTFGSGDSQAEGFFVGGDESKAATTSTTKNFPFLLSEIFPYPHQPRVVLPKDLYQRFYFPETGKSSLSCYGVGGALLKRAKNNKTIRLQIDGLLELGSSIVNEGQIEPAIGVREISSGGNKIIRLVAGERRFWSLVLYSVLHDLPDELYLMVTVQKEFNLIHQIDENLKRENMGAVGLAKAIALLLIAEEGIESSPSDNQFSSEYKRIAERKKVPDGHWDGVRKHINYSDQYLKRHLKILRLPDDLLYLCEVNKVPERVLKEILASDEGQWKDLVEATVENSYSSGEINKAVLEKKPLKMKKKVSVHQKIARKLSGALRSINNKDLDINFQEVAEMLSVEFVKPDEYKLVGEKMKILANKMIDVADKRINQHNK